MKKYKRESAQERMESMTSGNPFDYDRLYVSANGTTKSFIVLEVTGNTRPIKDSLKEIGYKWYAKSWSKTITGEWTNKTATKEMARLVIELEDKLNEEVYTRYNKFYETIQSAIKEIKNN